jgi:hypothetical protein
VPVQFTERQRAFPFRGAQLHSCHEPAQVAIALLRLDEDGKTPRVPVTSPEAGVAARHGASSRVVDRRRMIVRPAACVTGSTYRVDATDSTGIRADRANDPDGQLAADDRLDAMGRRGLVKPRGTVDAIAVEQRDGRIAERCGAGDDFFGKRRSFEKAEGRRGVKFDVHGKARINL